MIDRCFFSFKKILKGYNDFPQPEIVTDSPFNILFNLLNKRTTQFEIAFLLLWWNYIIKQQQQQQQHKLTFHD